jgi:hypothetical protein
MLRLWIPAVLQAFCLCSLSFAQDRPWQVCLDDDAGLNAPARAPFNKEFALLLASRGLKFDWSNCDETRGRIIQLTVKPDAPQPLHDVLGRAYTAGNSVSPQLEVFLDPVMDLMKDVHCWSIIGRALARVAAHEVGHFADQRATHAERGIMKAGFTGSDLSSSDSSLFYWRSGGD